MKIVKAAKKRNEGLHLLLLAARSSGASGKHLCVKTRPRVKKPTNKELEP